MPTLGASPNTKSGKLVWRMIVSTIMVILAWYIYRNRFALNYLKNVGWQEISLILLLDTFSLLITGALNYMIIRQFGFAVGLLDCILLQYVNTSLNRILPTVGTGATFRAIYLKKRYGFSHSRFISTVAGLYVISFLAASLIGILCLAAIYCQTHALSWVALISFLALFIVCLGIASICPEIPERNSRILKVLRSVVEGWIVIRANHRLILISVVLTAGLLLLSTLSNLIAYRALGFRTHFLSMLYLSSLGIIITLINFTPDGIGIREGIYVLSSKLIQLPSEVLVLGSLVIRGITMVATIGGGIVAYYLLVQRLRSTTHSLDGGETK